MVTETRLVRGELALEMCFHAIGSASDNGESSASDEVWSVARTIAFEAADVFLSLAASITLLCKNWNPVNGKRLFLCLP